MATPSLKLEVGGREVVITNPEKVFFPARGYTKLDLVNYYLTVAEPALQGVYGRPMNLKRFPNGAADAPFFQKRAPSSRPDWVTTTRISFPSGRFADEVICDEVADIAWAVNLGCIDLNPWPVRDPDVDHPDELRVDLDPTEEVSFREVKEVALVVNDVLQELGYRSFPKTSGSRGIHIYVRIEPRWEFGQVRRCALALGREVERRIPVLATTAWWKEERHGVFIDYNQNARDRTMASAYSVRPTPDARISCPVEWSELPDIELGDFTIETVPRRYLEQGDPMAAIDEVAHSLEPLLELVERQEREGLGDAPWPPQYPKAEGEPMRVQPSRARANANKPAQGTGRRQSIHPLITVAKAERKEDALAGLERWKARHPVAAPLIEVGDVLVDTMRGRSTTWTRIRVNLRHVPEPDRPAEETADPDYDPWHGMEPGADAQVQPRRARSRNAEVEAERPPPIHTAYQDPKRKNPADGRL